MSANVWIICESVLCALSFDLSVLCSCLFTSQNFLFYTYVGIRDNHRDRSSVLPFTRVFPLSSAVQTGRWLVTSSKRHGSGLGVRCHFSYGACTVVLVIVWEGWLHAPLCGSLCRQCLETVGESVCHSSPTPVLTSIQPMRHRERHRERPMRQRHPCLFSGWTDAPSEGNGQHLTHLGRALIFKSVEFYHITLFHLLRWLVGRSLLICCCDLFPW